MAETGSFRRFLFRETIGDYLNAITGLVDDFCHRNHDLLLAALPLLMSSIHELASRSHMPNAFTF
jgi:hypothetical protein